MDSDGHVTRRGHCCFANQSKALIDGFVELLASLGEIGHVVWNVDPQSRIGGCWKVHFTPRTCQPFRLARKLARVHVMSERISQWVSITSIEPVGQRHVRCVAVDSEDHLFLAGHGWHVTHNTHLYRPSNGGVAMADTIYRNATKFNARVIELTNAVCARGGFDGAAFGGSGREGARVGCVAGVA
jgi:hypothetical protein